MGRLGYEQITIPILTMLNKNTNNQLFLDIGAMLKLLFLSLLFNNFKSHAFEPVKHIYDTLEKNIKLNICVNEKISCYNFGISDKNERVINLSSNNESGVCTYGTNPKYFRKSVKIYNKKQLTQVKTHDYLPK